MKGSIARRRTRARRHGGGFTLIELMVVVLILAILIAIAIPTFLGAQDRARDRSTQSDLRNAVTAAKTVATDHGGRFLNESNAPIAQGDMPDVEPAIDFDDTSATTDLMYIDTEANGDYVTFVKASASGKFFGMTVDWHGSVRYCTGTLQTDCDDPLTDTFGAAF